MGTKLWWRTTCRESTIWELIPVAQDCNGWQAVVNKAMNLDDCASRSNFALSYTLEIFFSNMQNAWRRLRNNVPVVQRHVSTPPVVTWSRVSVYDTCAQVHGYPRKGRHQPLFAKYHSLFFIIPPSCKRVMRARVMFVSSIVWSWESTKEEENVALKEVVKIESRELKLNFTFANRLVSV